MLTMREAMALLHVSRPTVYGMMARGELVAERNPMQIKQKRLLFRRADVERLLREGRRRSSS